MMATPYRPTSPLPVSELPATYYQGTSGTHRPGPTLNPSVPPVQFTQHGQSLSRPPKTRGILIGAGMPPAPPGFANPLTSRVQNGMSNAFTKNYR